MSWILYHLYYDDERIDAMTDEKSCKNCAYDHAWVDAVCCPYQFLDMCESKSLKYFYPKDQGGKSWEENCTIAQESTLG